MRVQLPPPPPPPQKTYSESLCDSAGRSVPRPLPQRLPVQGNAEAQRGRRARRNRDGVREDIKEEGRKKRTVEEERKVRLAQGFGEKGRQNNARTLTLHENIHWKEN
ncbi:hypothetical protein E2C01_093619 [Portunus trituberculatus]|uniref:Uncharacterized protein n=1 Tax=Portunus trituberculatus TaxID=210409 RepID=A0A5B7JZ78_PORTR|nr:hypothetical protein [Portunus trituberculatus]